MALEKNSINIKIMKLKTAIKKGIKRGIDQSFDPEKHLSALKAKKKK